MGARGNDQGAFGPLFQCLNFTAFNSGLDPRHLQEQTDSRPFAEDRTDVAHDLAIFAQVEGGRNSSTRGFEGASIVVIAWEP